MPEVVTPKPGLPDPRASRAVLVGVSDYVSLEQLPAVANNIGTLRQVITDPGLWGLPDEHCVTLLNPASTDEVLDAVHTAASVASDALLVYFAGHGLLDERSDLYLALPDSRSDRLYRAVRYDDIRREVVGTARACYGKVVILDCCYSGRALQGGMGGSVELADHARVDGTYLMTASAETSVALAPQEEEYTAFTGALVDRLVHGVPDGPDLLDMETLFYHVRADLQARRFPVPQQRTRNDGKAIALVRNRRGTGRRTSDSVDAAERVLPQPPVGLEGLLRRRPADMYAEVQALRVNGQDRSADLVLAASAARRADQEVAAIIDLLRRQGLPADVSAVVRAAAQRPPTEVLRIVDALREIGLPTEADRLVRAVGAGRVADVASLAHLLQVAGRAHELVMLLDLALDTAQARSSLIGLVNALWVAGLREEVDGLIDRAVSKLPGPAVAALADELRAVGREAAAFGLYAASAEAVATRPPDVVAQLCVAMTEAGLQEESGRLAGVMIEGATGVESLLEIGSAMWDTGQLEHADRLLVRAAAVLSVSEVLALAAELRARDRDEAAYVLCLRAMAARPVDEILHMAVLLRDDGRPVDAGKLLEEVAGRLSPRTLFELLDVCGEDDRRRVLRTVAQREVDEVFGMLNALSASRPSIARQLSDLVEATSSTRVELVAITIDRRDSESKAQMLTDIVRTGDGEEVAALLGRLPADDAKLLMFLAVQAGNPTLASIVDSLPSAAGAGGDPALHYILDQPVSRLTALLTGLRAAHFGVYADAVISSAVAPTRGLDVIARDVAFLIGAGEVLTAEVMVTASLRGRTNAQITDMVSAYRRQNEPESLTMAAKWARATYADYGASAMDGILRQIGLGEYASRSAWLKRRRK